MIIDKATLCALEFNKVINLICDFSFAEGGRNFIERQNFFDSEIELSNFKKEVETFYRIYYISKENSVFFPNIEELFNYKKIENYILEGELIFRIAKFFSSLKVWQSFFRNSIAENKIENISATFLEFLEKKCDIETEKILATFDSLGNIVESHPDLVALQKRRTTLNNQIAKKCNDFFSTATEAIFQDRQPIFSSGRVLLPLKANCKSAIKGVVHHASSSGATIFVEPFELLELNNEAALLEREASEIKLKWLKYFSSQIFALSSEIEELYKQTLFFDSISARARYALNYNCTKAKSGDQIYLPEVTHPLLKKKAVATTVSLNEKIKTVAISGPNAGGKTVLLKTIATNILLNQFGCFVHCKSEATLPLFDSIFCVVGDSQSLSDGYSTFSGYMRKVASILNAANTRSLVLLDELGGGTDYLEGGVLAIAILENLASSGALTILTTHSNEIRSYIESCANAVNGTLLFDEEKIVPTYQFSLSGFCGSKAIEIASRSGLPQSLILKAKHLLKQSKSEELLLMEKLLKKEQSLKKEERSLFSRATELSKKEVAFKTKEEALLKKELQIKKEAAFYSNDFFYNTKKALQNLTSEINKIKKELSSENGEKIENKIGAVSKKIENITSELSSHKNSRSLAADKISSKVINSNAFTFEPNMEVLAGRLGLNGKIVRQIKANYWLVEIDGKKITFNESELLPATLNKKIKKDKKEQVEFVADFTPQKAALVLDLRGLTLASAKEQVEKQINLALLNNLFSFSIIHGLGDGILQQGIKKYLATFNVVEDFYFAPQESGGFGRTEVVLKKS